MRASLKFLSLAVLAFPLSASAKDINTDSKITAATVYNNRAKVTRSAEVDILDGEHKLVFENLPTSLMVDSLRVEGSSNRAVKFGAISNKISYSNDLVNPKEKDINAQIERYRNQIKRLDVEIQALNRQEKFVNSLGDITAFHINEDMKELSIDPEKWISAASTIQKQTSDILEAKLALNLQKEDLNEQIRTLQNELNQLRTGNKSSMTVHVPFESDGTGNLNVELSYQVPNANWSPVYDARLDTEKNNLEITQYGQVRQNTGEDWTDVKLTLSTAQPHRGTSLPNLSTDWVNIVLPQPEQDQLQRWRRLESSKRSFGSRVDDQNRQNVEFAIKEATSALPIMAEAPQADYEESYMPTFSMNAQIETGGFNSEYVITGKSTVLSDGTNTKQLIGTFPAETKLQVHVKPQLSTDAYLVANILLKGDSPLLPGQTNLFRDGAFVGKTNIGLLRPDDEHNLYFGIDDKVTVAHKVQKDQSKDAGSILSRDNERTKEFLTEIQNLHSDEIEIIVKQNMPVAQNEKIEIEIDDSYTTAGYKKDSDNVKGILEWAFSLKSKAEKNVKLGWTVKWPKDENISGL